MQKRVATSMILAGWLLAWFGAALHVHDSRHCHHGAAHVTSTKDASRASHPAHASCGCVATTPDQASGHESPAEPELTEAHDDSSSSVTSVCVLCELRMMAVDAGFPPTQVAVSLLVTRVIAAEFQCPAACFASPALPRGPPATVRISA